MNARIWVFLGLTGMVAAIPAIAAEQSAARMDRQLCSICHGPGGTTSSELFPQLAGQPATYFINQMKAFRDQSRADQHARQFMWGISSRLSDEDIQNLASYYEAQQRYIPAISRIRRNTNWVKTSSSTGTRGKAYRHA